MVQMSNLLPIFTNASEGPRAQGLVSGWISFGPSQWSDPRPRQRVEVYVPSAVRQLFLTFLVEVFFETTLETKKKKENDKANFNLEHDFWWIFKSHIDVIVEETRFFFVGFVFLMINWIPAAEFCFAVRAATPKQVIPSGGQRDWKSPLGRCQRI